jgi:hypothetical protein
VLLLVGQVDHMDRMEQLTEVAVVEEKVLVTAVQQEMEDLV